MDKFFSQIAERITSRKSLAPFFPDKSYIPIPFNKSNFHNINHSLNGSYARQTAFVDGGNAEIIGNNNMSFNIVRVSGSVWSSGKRISALLREYFLLVQSVNKDDELLYEAVLYEGRDEKRRMQFERVSERNVLKPDKIVGTVRKMLEVELALSLCATLEKGSILCLDGSLLARYPIEFKSLNELSESASMSGVLLCSISKTSSMETDTGENLVASVARIAADEGNVNSWFYHPICQNNNKMHNAELCIARLHENSDFVFIVEISKKSFVEANEIFLALSANSVDPIFIGYPYGLIDADKNARCSEEERAYLKSRFMASCKDLHTINRILNSNRAHDILDNIR